MSKVNRAAIILLLLVLLVGSVNAKKSENIVVSVFGMDAEVYYDYDKGMWYEHDWLNRDDPIIDGKVVALSFLEGKNYEEGIEELANSGREYMVIDGKKYYLSNLQQRNEFKEKALSYSAKPKQEEVQEVERTGEKEPQAEKVTEEVKKYSFDDQGNLKEDPQGKYDSKGRLIKEGAKATGRDDVEFEKGKIVKLPDPELGKEGVVKAGDTVTVEDEKWIVIDGLTLRSKDGKKELHYNYDARTTVKRNGGYTVLQGSNILKSVENNDEGKTVKVTVNKYEETEDEGLGKQLSSITYDYGDEEKNYKTETVYKEGKESEKIVTNKKGEVQTVLTFREGNWVEDAEKLNTLQNQYTVRKFFADAEFVLTQFSGLAGYSKLFFNEEALYDWRETVDEIFATMYLGTEYWTSTLCATYTDKVEDGTMLIETPYGMLEPAAHVEGERSETITYINESGEPKNEYFYKLSFAVDNPEDSNQDMDFNIYLYGDRVVRLYPKSVEVKEGGSFRRIGSTMIVQYSNSLYNKICIKFDKKIRLGGGDSMKELCNTITESSAPVTGYEAKKSSESEQTGGGEAEDQEADF